MPPNYLKAFEVLLHSNTIGQVGKSENTSLFSKASDNYKAFNVQYKKSLVQFIVKG
jgi:hypothetical protein